MAHHLIKNLIPSEWEFAQQYFKDHPQATKLSKKSYPNAITHSFVKAKNNIFALEAKHVLGEGVEGKVKVCQLENGLNTAVKIVKGSYSDFVHSEIVALQAQHRFLGFARINPGQAEKPAKNYIFEDLIEGKCLWDVFHNDNALFSHGLGLEQKLIILLLIVQGLQNLHLQNIIYGDLKLENMMMQGNGKHTRIAFVDFGFSQFVPLNRTYIKSNYSNKTEGLGAPEVVNNVNGQYTYDFASDIYSLGKVIENEFFLPRETYAKMLEQDPKNRPSLATIHATLLALLKDLPDLKQDTLDFIKQCEQDNTFEKARSQETPRAWKRAYPR